MTRLIHSDCIEAMRSMPDNSIDSVVTDPPYELGFMGKSWDKSGIAFSSAVWQEVLRVLKPGGHLLAFSGSRTYHRMAVAVEDAGFEIRDQIMWIYGSGFPKSLNIAKSIENKITSGSAAKNGFHKLKGERIGDGRIGMYDTVEQQGFRKVNPHQFGSFILDATTPEAQQWAGWGTALKPAHEPIVVARKPLIGTVAENVLTYGTGGLNIDGARVEGKLEGDPNRFAKTDGGWAIAELHEQPIVRSEGRWPANVIHDGSDEVVELFPDTKGVVAVRSKSGGKNFGSDTDKPPLDDLGYGDSGSAARFFYCAKASKKDRNEGLDESKNHHPTVKPTDLMRYLCRLVTPPNGTVLDPFMGSGSTGKACVLEGFDFIGIDKTPEYVEIAQQRINAVLPND